VRAITKGQEPNSLTQHRASPNCDYDNYADKAGLRATLVREQHGICCYCMGRIRESNGAMKIEHWRCRTRFVEDELVYANLLGACMGGEGCPACQQHCDTRKGDRDLKWNPANLNHRIESRVRYKFNGSITSNNQEFARQLDEVLNLNLAWLMNNRKAVLDAVLAWWRAERPVSRARLRQEAQKRASADGGGVLEPYAPVAAWWLRQKLEA